jgi:RNA polymerase sigma factor (TIGR02999 family)
VTRLLERLGAGDADARDELIGLLYDELHRLAQAHMRSERAPLTLQPTALVHEALMRLGMLEGFVIENRRQFFSLTSKAMRLVLVDHARARHAEKRGGDRVRITLDGEPAGSMEQQEEIDVLDVHGALEELGRVDAELAAVVELRYFGGLSVQEAAEALGLPQRTLERRLQVAGAWLRERLDG